MNENEPIPASRIHQIVKLIDLTNLNEDCDQAAIEALCAQSNTKAGNVAAVCIWPEFVASALKLLGGDTKVAIATVVNFPSGSEESASICAAIEKALHDGATEIDYVLPYQALINGDTDRVIDSLESARKASSDNTLLKVILETGKLKSSELIHDAAKIAIEHGADFIKTSTGKVSVNATPEAATIMLDAIADSSPGTGFKAAGGIKSVEDADRYLKLADKRLGDQWADSTHFRFGASSLLRDALNKLNITEATVADNKSSY